MSTLISFSAVTFTVVNFTSTTHGEHGHWINSGLPGPDAHPPRIRCRDASGPRQFMSTAARTGPAPRRQNAWVRSTTIDQPEFHGDQHPHRDRARFITRRFEAPLPDGVDGRSIELGMTGGFLHDDVAYTSIGLDMNAKECPTLDTASAGRRRIWWAYLIPAARFRRAHDHAARGLRRRQRSGGSAARPSGRTRSRRTRNVLARALVAYDVTRHRHRGIRRFGVGHRCRRVGAARFRRWGRDDRGLRWRRLRWRARQHRACQQRSGFRRFSVRTRQWRRSVSRSQFRRT